MLSMTCQVTIVVLNVIGQWGPCSGHVTQILSGYQDSSKRCRNAVSIYMRILIPLMVNKSIPHLPPKNMWGFSCFLCFS